MPSGLVSDSGSPARPASIRNVFPGSTVPVTASPYIGSAASTLCPPARKQSASRVTSRPPRSTSPARSIGSAARGHPSRLTAKTGCPPTAYTSDSAFAAAIRPQSYGSSTTGAKKSAVSTRAAPGPIATIAASSASSSPATRRPGGFASGRLGPSDASTCLELARWDLAGAAAARREGRETGSWRSNGVGHHLPIVESAGPTTSRHLPYADDPSGRRLSPGGGPGLQHRGGPRRGPGGFDPRAPPLQDDGPTTVAGVVEAEPIDRRREIPATDALLATPELAATVALLGEAVVKRAIHRAQQQVRDGTIEVTAILAAVASDLPRLTGSIEPVINATGVIVHTNLGRAPLSAAARGAVANASGYATVELDLRTGQRARRGRHVLDALVAATPGAEAALVVNNNAAALVLAAMALGSDREIVISRGELLEIGDGFRIAAILTAAGATAARGRLDEPDDSRRLRRGDLAVDRFRDQGPSSQLRDVGLHRRSRRCRAGRSAGRPRRRHRLWPAALAPRLARRARRGERARRRGRPGHRERRQAAGWSAGGDHPGPGGPHRAASPAPGGACRAGRQAHAGCPRGDAG